MVENFGFLGLCLLIMMKWLKSIWQWQMELQVLFSPIWWDPSTEFLCLGPVNCPQDVTCWPKVTAHWLLPKRLLLLLASWSSHSSHPYVFVSCFFFTCKKCQFFCQNVCLLMSKFPVFRLKFWFWSQCVQILIFYVQNLSRFRFFKVKFCRNFDVWFWRSKLSIFWGKKLSKFGFKGQNLSTFWFLVFQVKIS